MSGGDDGQRSSQPTYEMFWDCQYCGAKKLLGVTHRHCPSCGAAQDPGARYFPPEEEKVAVQDHIFYGADWACQSCQTPNSNRAEFCGNCGMPKDGNKKVTLAHERTEKKKEAPPPPPPPEKKRGGFGMLLLGCLGIGFVGLILFCGLSMFWTRTDTATVTSHTWARTIQIQEFQSARGDDWCTDMPGQAYDVRQSQKEKDTQKVPDGEDCKTKNVDNGDGTFHQEEECTTRYRSEPIYADWCDYKIDKWVDVKPAEAKGDGLSPAWPEPRLKTCSGTQLGCQREGSRKETYTLVLKDSGGTSHTCDVTESKWRGTKDGTALEVSKRVLGGGLDCSSL